MQAKLHIEDLKVQKLKKFEDNEFRGMVEALTSDLSDPAHLIPELLQNAEDAGATNVRIQLDENKMLFQHDGAKFEAKHVEAICGMCQSTKKNSLDYIGTFGIGFKSTFAVSTEPEIHSGSYSFRFNEEMVIVPEWVDPEDAYSKWNVTIVLPLKKEDHSHDAVLRQLEGFEKNSAKPMIFLDKLAKISIYRKGTENVFEKFSVEVPKLRSLPESFRFTEIKKNSDLGKRYCVYTLKKNIQADLLKHVTKKRKLKLDEGRVYETSIKVAFEIGSDGHVVPTTDGLLYAFLPTKIRTFLGFDVNAGFLLSTDREGLASVEDKYNRWLLERTIEAVETIVESYKEKAPMGFWPDIYRFFPRQEKGRESWLEESLCVPIKESFKKGQFFLTTDTENPWRELHKVIEASKEIRALFPVFSVIDHKSGESENRAYLSDYIDTDSRQTLVKEFEFVKIDEDFLLDVLSRRDFLKDQDVDWLLSLFALLGEKYSKLHSWTDGWKQKQFLDRARKCYLIPSENGNIVKLLEDTIIYRSTLGLPDFIQNKAQQLKQNLYKSLNQVLKEEEANEKQRFARDFVWNLIEEATPGNLYKDIIQPEFEKIGDGEIDEQRCEILDNFILFLKNKDVAKGDVKLRVKGKRAYRKAETLYLANSYLMDSNGLLLYDIEKLLSGCDDVLFVSSHYITLGEDSSDTEKMTGWKNFLIKCGVRDFYKFEQKKVFDAKNREEFTKKFQKQYQQTPLIEGSGKPYTGNDWDHRDKIGYRNAFRLSDRDFGNCFKSILNRRIETQDKGFFLEFLKMLDCKWDILKEEMYLVYFYTYANAGKQEIKEGVLPAPSSLSEWLQGEKWLPARSLPDGRTELKCPSEAYLFTPETEGIKGGFYVEPDNVRNVELRRLLGLKTVKPDQEAVSSPEETVDALLEKYAKYAADGVPLDKEMEKSIKKLYQRVNDAIKNGADGIQHNLKICMTRGYDTSRNWNDLSKIRYYVSDIQIIDELREDIKRDVLFLPSGLDPDSIKYLLTGLNKRDLLSEVSRTLPLNIRLRVEGTPYFMDLANALWNLLKDEKTEDDLKILCEKISDIKASPARNLCYELRLETNSVSNWIKTDGILLDGIFWFSDDLKDLGVEVAREICREFGFDKYTKDFIVKIFGRSFNYMTKVLKDSGKEYEVVLFKNESKTSPKGVTVPREETEPLPIETNEKVIPVEEAEPVKVETGVLGEGIRRVIIHPPSPPDHPIREQRRHTREETGRRGEKIMQIKILPEKFPGCYINFDDKSEYDFIVKSSDGNEIFIEVKSSASDEREFSFEMSEKQKRFAEGQGKKYQLWFLMNVWDEKPLYSGPCNNRPTIPGL